VLSRLWSCHCPECRHVACALRRSTALSQACPAHPVSQRRWMTLGVAERVYGFGDLRGASHRVRPGTGWRASRQRLQESSATQGRSARGDLPSSDFSFFSRSILAEYIGGIVSSCEVRRWVGEGKTARMSSRARLPQWSLTGKERSS
jgi:hypothetical protein